MDTFTLHMMTLDPLALAAESFHTKAHRKMVAEWEFKKTLERVRPTPIVSHEENLARVAQIWLRRDNAKGALLKATLLARVEAAPRVEAEPRVRKRKPRATTRAKPKPEFTEAQMQIALRAQMKRTN
jgi:hypothetical protein